MKLRALTTLCLIASLFVACRTAPILNPSVTLTPPASASLEEIGRAIVATGTRLGWVIQVEGPGEARGSLDLRGHQAVVKILFSKTSLRIDYVSSVNLMHSGDEIHHNYNNWVKNLQVRIQRKVAALD